uniref:Aprataxin and PNK-like factor PBZ domain-containing protein n=1 Tax=Plectus sambesii TaxID=2011161 RepID=A0A914UTT9_9BILA
MTTKALPMCRYGAKCYRKNAKHLREFAHPDADDEDKDETKSSDRPQSSAENNNELAAEEDRKDALSSPAAQDADDDKTASSGPGAKRRKLNKEESKATGPADFIKQKFLVSMPADFFAVWELAKVVCPENPSDAFESANDGRLVGAFDVLAGRFESKETELSDDDYLLHWRFAVDPPELQTVLVSRRGHYGYWRDSPDDAPIVVHVADDSEHFPKLTIVGDNLLAALNHLLTTGGGTKNKSLIEKMEAAAKAGKFDLQATTERTKARKKRVVAPTLHSVGIVVPVVDDVGYRPLSETNAVLKKTLDIIRSTDDETLKSAKLDALQEMVTYVQFANDEADFGMGLELGHDLFIANTPAVDNAAVQLLSVAYSLLKRPQFGTILKAHMPRRRRAQLSVLDDN